MLPSVQRGDHLVGGVEQLRELVRDGLVEVLLRREVLRVQDGPEPVLDQARLAEVLAHGELVDAVFHAEHAHHLHLDSPVPGVADEATAQSPGVGLTPTTSLRVHHQVLPLSPKAVKLVVKVAPESRQIFLLHTQLDEPASIYKLTTYCCEWYSREHEHATNHVGLTLHDELCKEQV